MSATDKIEKRGGGSRWFRVLCLMGAFVLAGLFCSCEEGPPPAERPVGESEIEVTAAPGESGDTEPAAGEPLRLILRDGVVDSDGKTVTVEVLLENNPGLSALQFSIHHGEELELQEVYFDSRFGSYITAPTPYQNPQMITFMSPLRAIDENGTFATLVFRISDNVRPNTTVYMHAHVAEDNTLDEELNKVPCEVVSGTVYLE